jgi:hypothetical protein
VTDTDIEAKIVEVLAIVEKAYAGAWLEEKEE